MFRNPLTYLSKVLSDLEHAGAVPAEGFSIDQAEPLVGMVFSETVQVLVLEGEGL